MIDQKKLDEWNEKNKDRPNHYVSKEALEQVMAEARNIPPEVVDEIFRDHPDIIGRTE